MKSTLGIIGLSMISLLSALTFLLSFANPWLSSSDSATSDEFLHKVDYYFDKEFSGFGTIGQFEEKLYKDIEILNNLCEKLFIKHRFAIRSFNHFGEISALSDEQNDKVKDYFKSRKDQEWDIIKIYLGSNSSPADSPLYTGLVPDDSFDECSGWAYGDGDLIFLPFNYKHDMATLLHEIAHKFVGGHEFHVGTKNNLDSCYLPKSNGCVNLMGENYVVPYSFLLTYSQVDKINRRSKCSPCTNSHVYPPDLIGTEIENKVDCCPDLKFHVSKDTIRQMIKDVLEEDDIDLVMKTIEIMLSHNVCPSQIVEADMDRIVELIINNTDCNTFSGFLKDVLCVLQDKFRIRRAVVIASRIYKQLYINSDVFKDLVNAEAKYLSNGNSLLAKHYISQKFELVKFIFNSNQHEIEEQFFKELASDYSEDIFNLEDLRDTIVVVKKIVTNGKKEIDVLKYRNDRYAEGKIQLINYDHFEKIIKNRKKELYLDFKKLKLLESRQAAIEYRIKLRADNAIDNDRDFAFKYVVLDKIGV